MGREPGIGPAQLTCPNTDTDHQWAGQLATQQAILQALEADQLDPHARFQAKVTVAACLAAASTAVLTWVENDGTPELPDLIEQAFDTLTRPQ